ncbi:hypothetical protein BU16DRAFT_101734 [Lophium mytilinum]|uniref:Uncharacterized protein n=1 Tax=Lophium mytilinum TaxID=390894 RepID=A0A6A6QJ47_9PEZI|nr:hypothetical protein BU16DRAFT_101734 [Lophium mytilinum]
MILQFLALYALYPASSLIILFRPWISRFTTGMYLYSALMISFVFLFDVQDILWLRHSASDGQLHGWKRGRRGAGLRDSTASTFQHSETLPCLASRQCILPASLSGPCDFFAFFFLLSDGPDLEKELGSMTACATM